jgi:sucrose-6-phosphatase
MRILATDLDRTLLPNGPWPTDPDAIAMFNELTHQNDVVVVYITGRNLNLTEKAITEYGVRHPDILCADVGATIRMYKSGSWLFDDEWATHIELTSPRWDAGLIRDALAGIAGLTQQEQEHLSAFKQSYYVDRDKIDCSLQEAEVLIKGNFDEAIVYSYDYAKGVGLLDILPQSATKQTALEYIARKFRTPLSEVIFCGDSGNDIFPLTAGFAGVLVRNADEQLVTSVKKAQKRNRRLKIYFATGNFRGLSGYYTSGVIEGAYHYGAFKE